MDLFLLSNIFIIIQLISLLIFHNLQLCLCKHLPLNSVYLLFSCSIPQFVDTFLCIVGIFYVNDHFINQPFVICYQVRWHMPSLRLIDEHLHYLPNILNFITIKVNGSFFQIIESSLHDVVVIYSLIPFPLLHKRWLDLTKSSFILTSIGTCSSTISSTLALAHFLYFFTTSLSHKISNFQVDVHMKVLSFVFLLFLCLNFLFQNICLFSTIKFHISWVKVVNAKFSKSLTTTSQLHYELFQIQIPFSKV